MLLDFSAADLGSAKHANDINAGASQRDSHRVLCHVDHIFDQRCLQD